jgi:hypothetical protein
VAVVDPFDAVSEQVRETHARAPESERALLELRLTWPGSGSARR